ncbi:MAG: hypothetical protein OSJ74_06280 [Clostridia bacterium]|nr:hypothetical protein [Clostridia bacterium]
MKKILSAFLIAAVALTLCLSFAACAPESQTVEEFGNIDYKTVLKDYLEYPDAANDAKMNAVERNVKDIVDDDSLTDAKKIVQIMERATLNEIECDHFAYFRNQMGETKIGDKSGQLIYQRLRKQSDTLKDDTTIKLPVNHNFGGTETSFVTSAVIRYVNNGKYNRIEKASDIVYNEETGILEVAKWKKGSKWDETESAMSSRSYDEARKTCINWGLENVVDSSKAISIESKTDDKGNVYYQLKFSIDVAVANADGTTIGRLENDNSGKNMRYEYCDIVAEIWQNGLAKRYQINESWSGKIGKLMLWYEGSATSKSEIIFSYSEADMDNSKTEAIYQGILNK